MKITIYFDTSTVETVIPPPSPLIPLPQGEREIKTHYT